MKVGLVGLGKMGILHAAILNTFKEVEICSVAEKENLLIKYIQSALPNLRLYQDYEQMLKSEELDLLYITTPVSSHLPVILSSIKNGVGFFVEKPLSKNLLQAKKIVDELKKSNVFNSVGYVFRFVETFSKAKSFLDERILGDITNVKASMYVANIFSKPSGWRFKKKESEGGVLLDLGCHLIDLLLWYFGPIAKVSGQTRSVYSELDDFANAKLEFKNKITGELDTSWSKKGYRIPEINLDITGTSGNLKVNQDFIEIKLDKKIPQFEDTESKIFKQSLEKGVFFDVGGPEFTKEDSHIVEAFSKKRQPLIDVFEAYETQSVIEAIYDSAKKNRMIKVEYLG